MEFDQRGKPVAVPWQRVRQFDSFTREVKNSQPRQVLRVIFLEADGSLSEKCFGAPDIDCVTGISDVAERLEAFRKSHVQAG